jgi:hypothetical protein
MTTLTLIEYRTGTTTTVGSSTSTVVSFDVSNSAPGGVAFTNCAIFVTGIVTGFDGTNNKSAGEMIAAQFQVVSGVLAQVTPTDTIVNVIDNTTGTPNSDFTAVGSVISFRITGVAAAMSWFGKCEYVIYQP